MKNILKKLHIMSNQSEDLEGSNSSKGTKLSAVSSPVKFSHSHSHSHPSSDHKPSALPGWLTSVNNRRSRSHTSSSNVTREETVEPSDPVNNMVSSTVRADPDPNGEEEYQIKLALELSAKEDPEAVQIEAVKQISLGSCPPENTPAEIVAFRYWSYNALSYDDKILDGFYDLYGITMESTSSKMPSLVDLQGTPLSDNVKWEAVLVNRAADSKLSRLEQKALDMAVKSGPETVNFVGNFSELVKKIAALVSNHMGGPVADPDNMLAAWRSLSNSLKATLKSVVLPLGSLKVGLARHRALLFKVLADSIGLPCRLVKGQQYTGSEAEAMNFVKIEDGREYIVDLMADPGTLIPSDAAGLHIEYEESMYSTSPFSKTEDSSSQTASSSSGKSSWFEEHYESGSLGNRSTPENPTLENEKRSKKLSGPNSSKLKKNRNHHARSPSWTEGVSSPAARKMKVKDVSQYMIDAAKENPQLAQKLHDVLLESGVVAPPNLFTEVYQEKAKLEETKNSEVNDKTNDAQKAKGSQFLPPLPHKSSGEQPEIRSASPARHMRNVPVTAAAAAAAVVASSMVVAAAARTSPDSTAELPVAAAATATAVAVVATTAAVGKQYENLDSCAESASGDKDLDGTVCEGERGSDKSTGNDSTKSDMSLDDVADCEIPWEDITLGERIGLGSYGEVYRGDWHGTEVAVKKFLDQALTVESLEEFKSEVRIMKKVRHPNVVLFMGAVTRAPNLSIITEFLPRGSLYRLLHRPNNQLDVRRRLRMALDAARGMNYLHNCTPVIVHRDLKSPNLLVDKNWVVKVCDFGLSRMKESTYLSSRSTAGTAEWMAPEVLRNEPSDEKCDVFSFGVILWELCTMQQPWGGMNPMQVVGAVGFQSRRLDIPDDIDPAVSDIIKQCWETEPKLRPSFAEIMAALKPLQKPITNSQVHSRQGGQEKSR
jgi:tRNA A-37 threonylcarbamoyl transferase component Bud32